MGEQYFTDCISCIDKTAIRLFTYNVKLENLSKMAANLVPRVLLGTKVPWWIVVTWFRFIAQILGNKIINFEGGNIIY